MSHLEYGIRTLTLSPYRSVLIGTQLKSPRWAIVWNSVTEQPIRSIWLCIGKYFPTNSRAARNSICR